MKLFLTRNLRESYKTQFFLSRHSKMNKKSLLKEVQKAYSNNQRLISPLMGFPGLPLVNSTIKLAQQNYGEHYNVLTALIKMFKPDMIFPLMDLSVEANALGLYTVFPQKDTATVLKEKIELIDQILDKQINISYDTRLQGYVETIKLLRIRFPETVMKGAYVTGPYSLVGLMIGAEELAMAVLMEPEKIEKLCEFAVGKIQEYIRLLIGAGAQTICVLEPTAVMLSPEDFEKYSSGYVKHINSSYKYSDVSVIYHTCGNTMHLIEKMEESGVDGLSLDSHEAGVDLPEVAKRLKNDTILIGNLNPTGTILNGTPEKVQEEVTELLQSMDFYTNYILSTGCDLPQDVPVENIQAFMDTGRQYRIKK